MMRWLQDIVARKSSRQEKRVAAHRAALLQARYDAARYRALQARYDAASLSPEAQRNWENVDGLAAQAAASPGVRALLRNRGRHELLNNPYMDGIVQTHAGDIVGRGPRLRVRTGANAVDAPIERSFSAWMREVRLAKQLRLAVETFDAQGECFIVLMRNPKLQCAIKLDIKLYEGDQCATPDLFVSARNRPEAVDGIEFDAHGNPAFYHFLRQHPGDTTWLGSGPLQSDRIPADRVIHLFRARRPGQRRGIPRITSSLTLFPERRSFRHSVLTAARVAAQLGAAFLKTDFDPNGEDDNREDIAAGTALEIEPGLMTALPTGSEMQQMKAEQPATTFEEFDNKLIAESARPLNMPSNIALCNSSGYNYASGRLDHQTYDRSIDIDQGDLEDDILDPLLFAWLADAVGLPGLLPWRTRAVIRNGVPHSWLWRKRPHVDPAKEATAQATRLESTTTLVARELADQGVDLEDHVGELTREVQLYRDAGLVHPAERKSEPRAQTSDVDDTDDVRDQAEEDGEAEAVSARVRRNGVHRNRLTESV